MALSLKPAARASRATWLRTSSRYSNRAGKVKVGMDKEKPPHARGGGLVMRNWRFPSCGLEAAYRLKRRRVRLEQLGEARELEGLVDALRDSGQNDLATVIPLAVSLRAEQGAESGTRHILQAAHVDHELVDALVDQAIHQLGELRSRGAIHATFQGDEMTMLEFFGGDIHPHPPSNVVSAMPCASENYIMRAWMAFFMKRRRERIDSALFLVYAFAARAGPARQSLSNPARIER